MVRGGAARLWSEERRRYDRDPIGTSVGRLSCCHDHGIRQIVGSVGETEPVRRKLPGPAASSTARRTRSKDSGKRCHSSIRTGRSPSSSRDGSAGTIEPRRRRAATGQFRTELEDISAPMAWA